MNDCVMRLGVIRGDYPWHRHDDEDELFYVVDGGLELDVDGRDAIPLAPGQGVVVPRGVQHRPRAAIRTIILMVEGAGVIPTGDETETGRPSGGWSRNVGTAGTFPSDREGEG